MFSFPLTGGAADKSDGTSAVPGKAPPCVSWEKLMLKGGDEKPTAEQKKLRDLHKTLLCSLKDEEARDMVTALVFLSTRSTERGLVTNALPSQ